MPYIGPVYEVLEHLTTQGDDPHLLALSCIGALATAAKEHFAPLVDSVAAHLKQLMRIRHLDQLPLLCQAIGTFSAPLQHDARLSPTSNPCLLFITLDTMGLLATSTQTTVASAHAHEAVNLALQAVQEVVSHCFRPCVDMCHFSAFPHLFSFACQKRSMIRMFASQRTRSLDPMPGFLKRNLRLCLTMSSLRCSSLVARLVRFFKRGRTQPAIRRIFLPTPRDFRFASSHTTY